MTDDVKHLFIVIGGLLVSAGPWLVQVAWLAGVGVELLRQRDDRSWP